MSSDVFKTVMQLVRILIETSRDKDEALKRFDQLEIIKDIDKGEGEDD